MFPFASGGSRCWRGVGPNGGGKTTLVRALGGLLAPRQGTIRLFGAPVEARDPHRISYVPQVKLLDRRFPALAIELVASGLHRRWPWRLGKEDRRRAQEALEAVGAPMLAGRPVAELSGGQLQRVYIARGLVRRPDLLLLDEPATGMDRPGEGELYRILDQFQRERQGTVIMVTHDWSVARHHATHAIILSRTPRGFGPAAETLTDVALRDAYGHTGHPHPMIGNHG